MKSLALLACVASVAAQDFSLQHSAFPAGGGASVGENFSLSGAIGQPDATTAPLSGGQFTVAGGFWNLFLLQTPGAPSLNISFLSATTARISWPLNHSSFTLQMSPDLGANGWSALADSVQNNGTENFVIVNFSGGVKVYRLFRP